MKKFQLFFWVALFLTVLVFLPNSVAAKDEWRQVRSKNFNLIGNAGEKDIRKVATKLEQFRETFRLLFGNVNLNSSIPTNVVVFKNDNAYKPFKPKRADGKTDNFIAGYFQSGEDVNYITLSTEGDDADTYGTIFHEYVHFIIDTNFGKSEVPPWYNEGLAEYYQTFAIEADQKVKLGLPQNGHLQLLQQNQLIPLETFFKISNYALHQNGNHSRSIFYAQSWALIHYLVQNGKSDGLGKFLLLALKDVPSEKAFQEAFQMTYTQMEKELKKYVVQNSYKYTIATFKNKLVFENEMQTSLMSEADTNAYLGDLLYHTNRADDAEPYLQKAIALDANSSMATTAYGMVKLRQNKFDEAKIQLEKAVSLGQSNYIALYRYAYLLSREGRDEFGYVKAFPSNTSAKIRELLKKAIAINPQFTESYELLAFVDLVNNEELDEAVSYLRKALQYQPGNQRYVLRIAEIYLRQQKLAEAAVLAEKIASTADDPQLKTRAENLIGQIRQMKEFSDRQQNLRRQYESSTDVSTGKPLSPEERAKAEKEAQTRSINRALRKLETNEKRVIGRIQKIDCKGKTITYAVKTDSETFALSSKDFENLALVAFIDVGNKQVGCGVNISEVNAVLTYKQQTDSKNTSRGELIGIDFVPKDFIFTEVGENRVETETVDSQEETEAVDSQEETAPPVKNEDLDAQRRTAIMQSIKNALRQPLSGEKRELGFIEKAECDNKGMFFYIKTQTQTLKLAVASPQAIQIRAFTPEIEQVQIGCGLKQIDVPVVFTYKENSNPKTKSTGEIISLEFVPKNFVLEK